MKTCAHCIMPADSPIIHLDDNGVCNYCENHRKVTYFGEDGILRVISENKGEKYDCMVNISGGRDSAYTLLKLVKDYNFKVLAVNYANPFTHETAKRNIENMVRILGVDFIRFELKKHIHERILRNNIIAWFSNPSPAMVPAICIGCKIIWPDILKIARDNKVNCIVNGGNQYEYTSFKKELLGVKSGADLKTTYFANFGGLFREAVKNYRYLNPKYLPTTLRGYLFANQYALGSQLLGRKIERIDLFHYIEWNEEEVITRIQNELDWEYPKSLNSTWRFDCNIGHLKDFMYMKTIGMTEKNDFYSKMVRDSEMTRDEALARIEKENELHLDIIEDMFEKLDIRGVDLNL